MVYAVAGDRRPPVAGRRSPCQRDGVLALGRGVQAPRCARNGLGRRARLARELGIGNGVSVDVNVDGRHPVAVACASVQAGVFVFPGCGGGVSHLILPGAAVFGVVYAVAADGRSPVLGGRVPGQRDGVLAFGRGPQARWRVRYGLGRSADPIGEIADIFVRVHRRHPVAVYPALKQAGVFVHPGRGVVRYRRCEVAVYGVSYAVAVDCRPPVVRRRVPAQTDADPVHRRHQVPGRARPPDRLRLRLHLRPGPRHFELVHRTHPVGQVAAPAPAVRVVEHRVGVRKRLPLASIPRRLLDLVHGHRIAVQILHRAPAQQRELRAVNRHRRGRRALALALARPCAQRHRRRVVPLEVVVVGSGVLGVARL